MECFQYPLDTKKLFRKKTKIRKDLLAQENLTKKKIAILGGSTTNEVVEQLENFLLYYGFDSEFYQSEYGQYWQDAMFGNSKLDNFQPDIIYIHTSWRNIEQFPNLKNTELEVEKLLDSEFHRFEEMWKALKNKFHCPIIQNNFDRPNYRLMGNRDVWDYRGRSNYISRLNQKFYQYAQTHDKFYINDLEYISQEYGLSKWGDSFYWHMYKYAMCMDAIPYVAQSIANIIKSIYGKNKKALILDLDNTLWGGVVGEDGVEGIKIGPEVPQGQVYTEFQKYCKELQNIGVVLAIDSKNDMKNAMMGLEHPDSVLKLEDFVDIKANWNPKDQNIREIAEELSLGIDSFVFVDDNPAEREIVSTRLPSVATPVLDNVENYIKVIDHSGYFEVTALSEEDQNKTKMYHAKAEACREAAMFSDYGEYLKSLKMTVVIDDFKPLYIQRIAQLTNKSNQFNLTTIRCSEDDIKEMQDSKENICLCGRLVDKFGDNGLVTVVVGEIRGSELHIKLWLMSCRVLKRELENVMMNVLIREAGKKGIKTIIGYYYPTSKNGMVANFYKEMGYKKKSEDDGGNALWELKVDKYVFKKQYMELINKCD